MKQIPDLLFPRNPGIVYMGTPDFALPALTSLLKEGCNILAVVTQPDRPKGRGRSMTFSPVKETALLHDLKVLQPDNINEQDFIDVLCAMYPDLFIVAAFGQILNQDVLAVPRFGAVNIHASLLPKYRGAAPIQWAIMDNEPVTGITLMKMAKGLDKGPVLMREEVSIRDNESAGQLFDRLAGISGDVIVRFLKDSAGKELVAQPQDDAHATYASKITKEMAEINWKKDAVKIASLIRAMDPSPGATTNLGDKKIKLFSPEIIDYEFIPVKPGAVVHDSHGRFIIETGKGKIAVGEIQLPGKNRMSASDFLRGNKIEKDTILGD
ncbi:MAG: methionyl-tRNA formyltransferase [Deltaproteobacteria bacterium]|nr:methionyl-tRNA formyltransferase [Deltaproteobacteria bacterium]